MSEFKTMKILKRCELKHEFEPQTVTCNYCCSIMEIDKDDIREITTWSDTSIPFFDTQYSIPKFVCGVCNYENKLNKISMESVIYLYNYQSREQTKRKKSKRIHKTYQNDNETE